MVTTRIDLADLPEKEAELLKLLLNDNKNTDVFVKDKEHHLRYVDPESNATKDLTITLSHDIIRRPRSKNSNETRFEMIDHNNLIGEGGFSRVFGVFCTLAMDNNHLIAKKNKIRVVKIQQFTAEEFCQVENEFNLTNKAKNLHIKKPAIVMNTDGKYQSYMVMRKLNGTHLYAILDQLYSNALELTTYQRLTIIINLLGKLKTLHENGIVHRDMKPDNVMLDLNSGDLEIFDYGLSKEAENIDAGEFLGSPGFIPLEVYLNQGTTAKSDIFSVSVIIALFWYADLPGQTAEEIANYQFHNIFKDDKIDLTDPEKNQILTTLKQMSKHERDDRYSAAEALSDFINIRETYVNRKIDEMGAVKSTPYRLENGLFVNNNKHHPKRIQHEELPPSHTCRF